MKIEDLSITDLVAVVNYARQVADSNMRSILELSKYRAIAKKAEAEIDKRIIEIFENDNP